MKNFDPKTGLFSNKDLLKLILPLFVEQVLAVTIGMADTMMVSVVGEAAVSGISLIDSINVLLINIFAALATGGAVVASQYLGRQEPENACTAAKQLLFVVLTAAVVIMGGCLLGGRRLLGWVFGPVEQTVMDNAAVYFAISALSYPFLALYNAGAALFRTMGNSKVSMFTALLMNVVNIGGNAILIFGFNLGVAGAAIASLASRVLGCAAILFLLRHPHGQIRISGFFPFRPQGRMVSSILSIGVPNGLENGMFQLGKILVQSLVASFGTTAIAANAVANNVASMQIMPGSAIGLALITVVGQCVGAGDYLQARYYTRKLMKAAYLSMIVLNLTILLFSRSVVGIYGMSPQTTAIALQLLLLHGSFAMLTWPAAFTLPNALRAANDARFTMAVSMVIMWTCRVGLSYLFARGMGMGVFGVWLAMITDWFFRSAIYVARFHGNKWEGKQLI